MSQTANTIRHFDGFNPTLEKPRDMLPVGGYICKIIKAKAENRVDGFQELDIMVEITEGPYAGFFRKDYDAQNRAFTPGIAVSTGSSARPTTCSLRMHGGWTSSTQPWGPSLTATPATCGTGMPLP